MKTMLWIALIVSFCIIPLERTFSMIAPINKGITLGRTIVNDKTHTLLIKEVNGEDVFAVDLSLELNSYPTYALDIFENNFDFTRFTNLLSKTELLKSFKYSDLLPAISESEEHIGVAGNYPEHAAETSIDKSNVFIFPKRQKSSKPLSKLKVGRKELLDYEVELCVVFDRDIESFSDYEVAIPGIFLCNDWSERSVVLRNFDTTKPELAGGFADGKSLPGYYQAGPFMLVPKNIVEIMKEINLTLTVNQELRQNQKSSEMILDIENLVKLTLEEGVEEKWFLDGNRISILPSGTIKKGMSILTGTPEGVVFRAPSKPFIAWNVVKYLLFGITGPFYKYRLKEYVIEKYIKKLLKKRKFLRPGDNVRAEATFLGYTQTEIIGVK